MAQFAPQNNLFKNVSIIRKILNCLFWLIFTFSISPPLLKPYLIPTSIIDIINILTIIGVLSYFILELIVDLFLIPQAEQKRRDDFMDNSLGSMFSLESSQEYYDNDEIEMGLYKVEVNLFQNCFFSYNLIKSMTIGKIALPTIVLTTIWIIAYYGFKEVPFFLSLLQVLFSANILGSLIKHLVVQNRLQKIQADWIELFQYPDFKNGSANYNHSIIRNWLRYETLIAKIPLNISDKHFHKKNDSLTKKWTVLKEKYNIH